MSIEIHIPSLMVTKQSESYPRFRDPSGNDRPGCRLRGRPGGRSVGKNAHTTPLTFRNDQGGKTPPVPSGDQFFQCLMFRFYVGISVVIEVTADMMGPGDFVTLYGNHIQGLRITAKHLPWPCRLLPFWILFSSVWSQDVMVGDRQNGIPLLPVKIDHLGRFFSPVAPICMGVQIGFVLSVPGPVHVLVRVVDKKFRRRLSTGTTGKKNYGNNKRDDNTGNDAR